MVRRGGGAARLDDRLLCVPEGGRRRLVAARVGNGRVASLLMVSDSHSEPRDNDQLSMDEETAKRLARPFEELVVRLLESQYAHTPFVCVTVASHDGGFDGVVRLNVLQAQRVEHLSLVEAKLRSSRELELAAIGKSVVIAYNASANALYIATNRSFAPQALKQLALFQWKTNLRIVLLDGGVLSAWVQRERAALRDFDAELLDYVAQSEPRDRPVIEFIDPYDETPVQAHVSTVARLPRYEFHAGWDGASLAPNELRPAGDPRPPAELFPLIGASRTAAVARIAGLLEQERGTVLVSGGAGAGKSFFIRHLRREIAERGMASTLISMTGVTTRRMYFMRVLAALTGANVELIATDEGPEGLEALLSTLSDEARPSERQAVAAILASTAIDPFHEKPDLCIDLITRYLERLALRAVRTQILFYDNLEHSTREVLDILRHTTRRLVRAGVSTVVEARRFGEAGMATERDALDQQRLSPEEWGIVRKALEEAADIEHYEVADLTDVEAVALIERHWPGFGAERAAVIIRSVGRTPLYIESALHWLQVSHAVEGSAGARVVVDLETFFERISPTQISLLFRKHLDLWRRQHEPVLAAASLLDGQVPFRALAALYPGTDIDATARALIRTRLFELDPNDDAVRTVHNLLTDELENLFGTGRHIEDGSPREPDALVALRRVAKSLLPELEAICGADRARLKGPYVLGAAGQWSDALRTAEETMRAEAERREWTNVSALGAFALLAAERPLADERERNQHRLQILLDLVRSEQRRGRVALDVNARHVEELATRIRTTPLLSRTPSGRQTLVHGFLLAADHYYAREEFEHALAAAVTAEEIGTSHPSDIADDIRARAFHLHGLALKGLDRREESFRVYAEAVARLPNVAFLRNEERSNLAAFNLMTSPRVAQRYYAEILAARQDEPDARKLHVLVDVAMAEFLMKQYASARRKAELAREIADDQKSYLEAARARNILGCCAWVQRDVPEADLLFAAGCFAAERTLSKRYLWRIRVNRAGTALEGKLPDVAHAVARAAEDMITTPRRIAIAHFDAAPDLLRSRWYVALIAIGSIYLRIDPAEYRAFLDRVPIAALAIDCPSAAKRQYRGDVFDGTTHLHAKRIMITG
ncbi:MAG TPA: AAA family ATPase [Thermoanaerobaculia bacterium]|nr:AAA family ATPase [Thermoanaerobaculia bacterium]